MSHLTHRPAALTSHRRSASEAPPATLVWLFGGILAAGVGFAASAALVTLLWVTSPFPDSGADGALHIAADLWLLAHGAQLVRDGTLSGAAAPVGLTPLLLTVLPVWLLARATGHGIEERDARNDGRGAVAVAARVSAGYLLVGTLAVGYAADGPLRPDLLSAALHLPLFVAAVSAVAAWSAIGRPVPAVPGSGRRTADVLYRPRLLAALRAAGLAVAVLCAGGALVVMGGVLQHADVAHAAFRQLVTSWSGGFAVLLLAAALLPNAAVWAASYGLGPGFTAGAGSTVAPGAVEGHPVLPDFPLFAGLPAEGHGTPAFWVLAGLLPLLAGTAGGWCVARSAVPVRGSRDGVAGWRGTACAAGLAACACGAAMALLAACAGGAMGTRALAQLGPAWWLTGAAACAWTALLGTPVALTVRAWRLRSPDVPAVPWPPDVTRAPARARRKPSRQEPGGTDEWHAGDARRARWAELKKASDGLMSEFGPR